MGDISQSPEDIILKILSCLETTKQPGVIIFGKTWYNAWITYPILIFDSSKNPENRKKLFNFIDRTLQRYQEKTIHIEKLKLSLYLDDTGSAPPVRDWIRIAVQNGVKSLDLTFGSGWKNFNMNHSIFEGNSLRELKLEVKSGRAVRRRIVVRMMKQVDDKVMFNHLQNLYLKRITINDVMFEGMLASCPLIEELFVVNCDGLERIKVTNLYKLNKFNLYSDKFLDVEIEAPSLQFLDCCIPSGSLKLYKTDMLKSLELMGFMDLSLTPLDKWEHKFPQVEVLTLLDVKGHSIINLSSHSLKHIFLNSEDLMKVNIDAPNLKSLKFYGNLELTLANVPDMVTVELDDIIDLSLTNAPSEWVLKIAVSIYDDVIGTDHLCRLKQLLAKATNSKISLGIGNKQTCEPIDVDMIPTGPAVEVEDIQLRFCFSTELVQSNFLEALFLTCHPKIIIIRDNRDLVNYLSKKLIERRKRETKCWAQELKEVQLQIYDVKKHQWKLVSDWTSLPEKKKRRASVRFMLQWKT